MRVTGDIDSIRAAAHHAFMLIGVESRSFHAEDYHLFDFVNYALPDARDWQMMARYFVVIYVIPATTWVHMSGASPGHGAQRHDESACSRHECHSSKHAYFTFFCLCLSFQRRGFTLTKVYFTDDYTAR